MRWAYHRLPKTWLDSPWLLFGVEAGLLALLMIHVLRIQDQTTAYSGLRELAPPRNHTL